ncbi:hypothetical protein IAR55_003102 [Kwoniella newhampshirensis]|uniref:Short-chain dehydrogenase n=1 Tax=Kwoniella newhampshirensis TaxID=1651941 RepID=A0AAW0YTA0_9TREE
MAFTSSILITGGTSGLGYETALTLAKSQPTTQIIVAARNPRDTAETINALTSNDPPNVVYLPLDLMTRAKTREFVKLYESNKFPPLRALILNAGLQLVDKVIITSDGIEAMFAIDHVNQALLFFLLRDQLTETARVILVGSSAHDPATKQIPAVNYTTVEAAAHPPTDKKYEGRAEGMRRYGTSKLCNYLFAYSLARHVKASNRQWRIIVLDPGVMPTRLYRWLPGPVETFWLWILPTFVGRAIIKNFIPTEVVAATLTRVAVADEYGTPDMNGRYIHGKDGKDTKSSVQSYNVAFQEELYDWTVKEIAIGNELEDFKRL